MELTTLVKEPNTVTLVTTYKCSSACRSCCFGCSPKRKTMLSTSSILDIVARVASDFPMVKVLVLTGGECTLLKDLDKIIAAASHLYAMSVRIVTNAHWATSLCVARKKICAWKTSGLKEINISTGDEHLQYIPITRIKNAIIASVDEGFVPVVNIEADKEHTFNERYFYEDPTFLQLVKERKLILINGMWVDFQNPKSMFTKSSAVLYPSPGGCVNLFNNVTITPDCRMKACCGITSNVNRDLDLGNIKKYSMRALYNKQFVDFMKIWLYVEGPHKIIEFVANYDKRIVPSEFAHLHQCVVCSIVLRNEEIMKVLKAHYMDVFSNIILKYNFSN